MTEAMVFSAGCVVGAGVVLVVTYMRARRQVGLDAALVAQLRDTFGSLSRDALSQNSEEFLKLAGLKLSEQSKQSEATLDSKKQLIDKNVEQIAQRLKDMQLALQQSDKERKEIHGALTRHAETTATLQKTASQLREALANPQRRGQWGERMAEDVLRLAGFVEGVNYEKQSSTDSGTRPDFTFLLPQDRRLHMDVKFPLPNYLKYLDAEDDAGRDVARQSFLRDVRSRIKDVTTRDYIDPDRGTVDYVLVFIPNEQIYSFIHEHDATLLDDAIRQRVVLCSPLTLYALLAVVRQAAEHYRIERTSREILNLLGEFQKQWGKYTDVMEKMGGKLNDAVKHYELLTTTRTRQLDRQLDKIEELRSRDEVNESPQISGDQST
jgi:DNA recombination protein RmuC